MGYKVVFTFLICNGKYNIATKMGDTTDATINVIIQMFQSSLTKTSHKTMQ